MELSKRLYTVASAVSPGCRVADIGTDHGYIPIYLVKNKYAPRAFAMDVNQGPLERAREHIQEEGLTSQIETRLSNGLLQLEPEEVDAVVIAGMGGSLICRILETSPEFLQTGKELILQPQSEWFKVRHLLHRRGYSIKKEWFLEEEGKYYVVIKGCPLPEGETERYEDEFSYVYGKLLLDERNPVLLAYMQKECAKKESILAQMKAQTEEKETEDNPADAIRKEKRRRRMGELEEEIKNCRAYIHGADS